MKKLLLSTVAFAALAIAPVYAQSTTGTMLSGTGVTCAPSTTASPTGTTTGTTGTTAATTGTTAETTGTTTGTTTGPTADTTGATTGAPSSSTMALSANNQIDATVARTALTNAQTNVDKLSSLSASTVCLVDLDTLAQSDATLKDEISKAQTNNAQIKSTLEANTALMSSIKTNHPSFDVSKVRAVDIGPNGELVLYVISGT